MSFLLFPPSAPRARSAGAPVRPPRAGPRPLPGAVLVLAGLLLAPVLPASARAQTPDTIPPDTVPRDTLPGAAGADTLPSAQDTLPVPAFPGVPEPVPSGWSRGVWSWSREEILANRGLTLADLVAQVPGMVALRGGDYGLPRTVTAFAMGGGRIRVFWDGFEIVPLEEGAPDLAWIGLGGLDSVRVERSPGEIRIELASFEETDPRPYSLVEAGTGDLDTNLFRGTFQHPRALGGSVALALDRIDTRGRGGGEPSSATGGWLRYHTLLLDERLGLRAELRRRTVDRDTVFAPGELTRTDWMVQARGRFAPGIVAGAFLGRSSLKAAEADETGTDGTEAAFPASSRTQGGLRVGVSRGGVGASGAARLYRGEGLPDSEVEVGVRAQWDPLGGISAEWARQAWNTRSVASHHVRAWTTPRWGLSLFGAMEGGERGYPRLPVFPPPDGEPPPDDGLEPGPPEGRVPRDPLFTDRTAYRGGAAFRWRGLSLEGARLLVEADSLRPTGLPFDREGVASPGGRITGWEASARVPVPVLDGLALVGSLQSWDDDDRWPYLPRQTYDARVDFHDVFFPTGNLEVWTEIGVVGRDPMTVPLLADPEDPSAGLARVPFYQSWFARLQIRVVTVRVFVSWENFTLRPGNEDLPGRLLPTTRAMYGVRWTLWN